MGMTRNPRRCSPTGTEPPALSGSREAPTTAIVLAVSRISCELRPMWVSSLRRPLLFLSGVMKVLTINLWARFGDWSARRAVLRRALTELEPDLVAFIEAVVLPGYDQVRDLTDGLEIVHQRQRTPDGAGISIASRLPVRAVHEMDLHIAERPRDFPAGAMLVEVDAGGPLLFVNHMPSWQVDQENERERQTVIVARKIEELGVERVVVAGDMDADPDSSSIRFWTGHTSLEGMSVCYRDTWE